VDSPLVPELRGDFHVHSTFSDDAHSSIPENIDAAVAVGLSQLRLIDHVRQSTTWVPEFLAVVREQPSREGLEILTGVEAKILDSSGRLDIPSGLVIGRGGVDAVVIADHQFPGTNGAWTPDETRARLAAGLSVTDAMDLLIGALDGAMRSVPEGTGQLAHCFSILPKIGLSEDDLGDDQLSRWAATAAETGTLIEVNEKWGCPGPRALRAAFSAGARVVASTDSHWASEVGRYDRVIALLSEARS
jgi:putative hydrolase